MDESAASEADKEQREWMIRCFASIAIHFVNHAWQVRTRLDSKWQTLHSSSMSMQRWMDRLATWMPIEEKTSNDNWNGSRDSESFVITSAKRRKVLERTMAAVDLSKTTWILVESEDFGILEQSHHPEMGREKSIALNTQSDPSTQLQLQWQRLCQRSSHSQGVT